jgi:hypothetical protein
MTIDKKARYTTEEICTVCQCGPSSVYKWVREACRFDVTPVGRYSILGRFVYWMRQYRFEPGQFNSPNRASFGEWLDKHNHRRPRLEDITLTAVVVSKRKNSELGIKPADVDDLRLEISQLRADVERLMRDQDIRKRTYGDRKLEKLPAPNGARRRVSKTVAGFIAARTETLDYQTGWTEVYQRFFALVGPPDPSWWSFQAQNETKLEWFEKNQLLGLLADSLATILDDMRRIYPENDRKTQRELFG